MPKKKTNRKAYFYLLIVVPTILLILVNIGIFVKRSEEKITYQKIDLVKERYNKTLKKIDTSSTSLVLSRGFDENIQPEIAGSNGIIVDKNTGKILYGLNISERKPIASLVKIMTALVAIEHGNLDDEFIISQKAASVGENSMGLSEGEVFSLRELLYGMMLNSGNDAATAIAEGVAGNVEVFVHWMNIKALELGLNNTYFADSCGLDDSSYSTVEDLAKLTHQVLQYNEFKEIVRTVEQEYAYSDKHKYIYLYNQTNLLTTYPGVLGVKTGFTEEAGLCLVSYALNEGKELIGVVLNSIDRKGDMIIMLDYGFSNLGVAVEHHLLDG